MASTPEKRVKESVVRILKRLEIYYFFPVTGGYGHSGIPDIVCCAKGRFIGIECKAGKGRTTALQDAELEKIRDAGGSALVVNEDSLGQLEAILLDIMTLELE
jgi:hypothetical protein